MPRHCIIPLCSPQVVQFTACFCAVKKKNNCSKRKVVTFDWGKGARVAHWNFMPRFSGSFFLIFIAPDDEVTMTVIFTSCYGVILLLASLTVIMPRFWQSLTSVTVHLWSKTVTSFIFALTIQPRFLSYSGCGFLQSHVVFVTYCIVHIGLHPVLGGEESTSVLTLKSRQLERWHHIPCLV